MIFSILRETRREKEEEIEFDKIQNFSPSTFKARCTRGERLFRREANDKMAIEKMIETRRKFQEREKERSASKKKKKKKRYSHSSFLTCSHLSCSRAKKRVERIFFFPISRYPGYINRNTDGKMLCGSIYCVCMCVCKCVICVYMTENKREKSSPTVLPTRFLLENVNIGKDFARQSHQ